MEESFKKLVESAGRLNDQEITLLQSELKLRKVKQHETLLEKGQVCHSFCFIKAGAFFQYKLDHQLDKNIIDLNVSHDWVLDHESFSNQKPSNHTIQAFEDSVIYELSIHAIHRLIAQSQAFLQMGKIMHGATDRLNYYDNSLSPEDKYQHLLKTKPEVIQKFPQKMIASYLKITPETLSRVRNRISRKD